jgi:hypothetical protein
MIIRTKEGPLECIDGMMLRPVETRTVVAKFGLGMGVRRWRYDGLSQWVVRCGFFALHIGHWHEWEEC